MRWIAPATVLSLLLGGCTVYKAPKFTVINAAATQRTGEGVAMLFTLDAQNENDVGLPLRDVEYTVELDGQRVFSGTRSAEATLRRLGTQQVMLPAVMRLSPGATPPAAPSRYRISGTVTYVTPGQIAEILFDTGVRVPKVGFSGSGELDFSGGAVSAAQAGRDRAD